MPVGSTPFTNNHTGFVCSRCALGFAAARKSGAPLETILLLLPTRCSCIASVTGNLSAPRFAAGFPDFPEHPNQTAKPPTGLPTRGPTDLRQLHRRQPVNRALPPRQWHRQPEVLRPHQRPLRPHAGHQHLLRGRGPHLHSRLQRPPARAAQPQPAAVQHRVGLVLPYGPAPALHRPRRAGVRTQRKPGTRYPLQLGPRSPRLPVGKRRALFAMVQCIAHLT